MTPPEPDYPFEPVPESTNHLRQKLKARKRQAKRQRQKPAGETSRPKIAFWPRFSPKQHNNLASPQPKKRLVLGWPGVWAGGLLLVSGGTWLGIESSLPNTQNLPYTTSIASETLMLKSADNVVFFQSGPATRHPLTIQQIPQKLQEAFLSTEDRRFYQHGGIDPQGIGRAIISNILTRDIAEGGSTLTQQLARISYLSQEQSIWRKLREARLAQKIEAELSKPEILERYLNQVYLGSGAYGVGDAARVYFSKPPHELSLAQMATLAGLPAAPSLYSPFVNAETAKKRRDVVLSRMVRAGYITQAEANVAQQANLELNPSPPPILEDKAPYFSSYVRRQLTQVLSAEQLKAGGLTVETTLNYKWQNIAAQAVQDTVYYDGYAQGFDQGALVSIDPRNGEIKTMVGGTNFQDSQFNRVTQAHRQPGSTFKAFVYAAAIASGLSPYESYLDQPFAVDGYKPKNYSRQYRGWVSMDTALTHSLNIPAVRAIIDVGFQPTLSLAHNMGIQSKLNPYYSTALGGNEVTLLELTSGYGTIAAQGVYATPRSIRKVIDRNGEVLYESKVTKKQALDPTSAAIMTWMLRQVIEGGTGTAARLNQPAAGKTGTSEDSRDLWFVGFVPQLVTGVWLGNDDNYKTYGNSSTAASTWRQLMSQVVQDLPAQDFPKLPALEGRKGSIKAKPVRPASMYNIEVEESREQEANQPAE